MRTKRLWLAVLTIGLVLAPCTSVGQTSLAVSSKTSAQDEQNSAPAVSPENQATKAQLAKLFEAMRVREQAMRVSQGLQIRLRQQLQVAVGNNNSKLPLEQRTAIKKLLNQYSAKAPNVYPIDEMLADMSTIYQRHLTREDIDATITFYSSRAGQNLLNAEPKIAREALPMIQQRSQDKGDALIAEMKKDLTAIRQQSISSDFKPVTNP